MKIIKSLSISAILIMLLVGFAPAFESNVANSANSSAAFNTTQVVFTSLIELAPYSVIVLAAAAIIGGLSKL
ncbi:hypothetical protein [Haloquadratum walsbyi]|jgi:hypothetical protein|uniref:hypothetical protein n=1 Tax=Haloquadratum walsbyi TaxID=293091 RepID=UPI0015F4DA8B|nr:hypothetical protein [Haloquadratum walsbyi]